MTNSRALVLLLSSLLLAGCRGQAGPAAAATAAAKVDHPVLEAALTTVTLTPETEKRLAIVVEAVAQRSIPRIRLVAGEAIIPPGMTLDVTAPVTGTLAAATVPQPGRLVRRGEPLFRIVPLLPTERDLRIIVERDLATARAVLEAAQKKSARAEQLLEDGSGSRRAAEEARAELTTAQAALEAATARRAVVNRSHINDDSELVVPAPIDGVVEAVLAAPGQTVAASAKLVQISRLDRLWVKVPVYAGETRDLDLKLGADIVRLGEPADSEGIPARPVAAPPTATPAASAIDLMFELPGGSGIRPGERVHVRLAGRAVETGSVIPDSALLHDIHGGTWVYERTAPHAYARRRVEVRDTLGGFAILTRGPATGTPVVTTGAAELFGIEFGAGK
jgi:membrane fusion protein, heavy metal efflux system